MPINLDIAPFSGGDGGIRTHVPISGQNDFESCAEKALAEQAGPELVSLSPDFWRRQAVFEGPNPEKWLWYESNRHPPFWPRLARFFGKMQDFMQDN